MSAADADEPALPPSVSSPGASPGGAGLAPAGLSIRDYFAGCALSGMLANKASSNLETTASAAYRYADAMLRERAGDADAVDSEFQVVAERTE